MDIETDTDIKKLIDATNSENILDYGSGKGNQYSVPVQSSEGKKWRNIQEYWNVDEIYCFDPGYEPFNRLPQKSFDGVVVTDVLEHCPVEDVRWILEEIFSFSNKFVFANIACYPARTTLPNSKNAHCTILPAAWWKIILSNLIILLQIHLLKLLMSIKIGEKLTIMREIRVGYTKA